MFKSKTKTSMLTLFFSMTFLAGWTLGVYRGSVPWLLSVNGTDSKIPVRVIKNMYFVALSDLAKLPGWSVNVDLGKRKIALTSPNETPAVLPADTRPAESDTKPGQIEVNSDNSGPPSNVRMTVQAALVSLDDLRKALSENASIDVIKQKRDNTSGIVQQAQNLLWGLPRTRTLQADIQVALDDLQSQINLILAANQAQEGLLPWTHPAAQSLMVKYPDLRPCHVSKSKNDGLDITCAQKMLSDLAREDFNDVQRDLDQYR